MAKFGRLRSLDSDSSAWPTKEDARKDGSHDSFARVITKRENLGGGGHDSFARVIIQRENIGGRGGKAKGMPGLSIGSTDGPPPPPSYEQPSNAPPYKQFPPSYKGRHAPSSKGCLVSTGISDLGAVSLRSARSGNGASSSEMPPPSPRMIGSMSRPRHDPELDALDTALWEPPASPSPSPPASPPFPSPPASPPPPSVAAGTGAGRALRTTERERQSSLRGSGAAAWRMEQLIRSRKNKSTHGSRAAGLLNALALRVNSSRLLDGTVGAPMQRDVWDAAASVEIEITQLAEQGTALGVRLRDATAPSGALFVPAIRISRRQPLPYTTRLRVHYSATCLPAGRTLLIKSSEVLFADRPRLSLYAVSLDDARLPLARRASQSDSPAAGAIVEAVDADRAAEDEADFAQRFSQVELAAAAEDEAEFAAAKAAGGGKGGGKKSKKGGKKSAKPFNARKELLGVNRGMQLAWAFNGTLLLAAFIWLALLLYALDQSDEEQAQQLQASGVSRTESRDAMSEAFAIALVQSLVVVDALKVLAFVFTSPQLLQRLLPPDTLRNKLLLKGLRRSHKVLDALM